MSTATPSGQSVLFVIVPHTSLELLEMGLFMLAVGTTMQKTTREMMFMTEPTSFNRARNRVGIDAMTAWLMRMRAVKVKVCQCSGTKSGFCMALAANIIEAQALVRRLPSYDYTIINTGRTSNLSENITPSCNPLNMSFIFGEIRYRSQRTPSRWRQYGRSVIQPSLQLTAESKAKTAVGILEQSSAIEAAKNCIIMIGINDPQTIPPVPAYLRSMTLQEISYPSVKASVAATEGSSPNAEKLRQKLLHKVNLRRNSWR